MQTDVNAECKQHCVGIFKKGHILGIEDFGPSKSTSFSTSAQVMTQECNVYMIERDVFCKILHMTQTQQELSDRHKASMQEFKMSIKKMKRSNFAIVDSLKRSTTTETNPKAKKPS
jgi:hypothetical protein